MDFLVRLAFQGCQDRKALVDQREILVSQEFLVVLGAVVLMAVQDLKVSQAHLAYLELVAHLDLSVLAHWGSQAPLDLQARWDRQDSLEEAERKETLAPLV